MISKKQLDELQEQIDKDEKLIAELRLKRFIGAGETYSAAKGRIALAQDVLDDLTAQYEAEQAVIGNRPNVEKAEAKYLDGAARALVKADDRIRAALEAAQKSLMEVIEATKDRAALVDETAAQMAARGFTLRDDVDEQPHETGAERQLSGTVVRIRGRWWAPLAPLALVDWLQHRVIAARMPNVIMPFCLSCRNLEERSDNITDGVPDVPAVPVAPPPVRPARVRLGAPVYIYSADEAERRIDEDELQWTSMPVRGEDGKTEWKRVPPTDQAKERAATRKKVLHDGIKDGIVITRV